MKYGRTAGVLKPLDELVLPDPRIEVEWYRPDPKQALSAGDIHERLEKYARLHSGVPERIKTQFDIARNLMLTKTARTEVRVGLPMSAPTCLGPKAPLPPRARR